MNYVLVIVILIICYGSYCEIKSEQDKNLAAQQQLSDLGDKLNKLQDENKNLQKNLNAAQLQVADLTTQIQSGMGTGGAIQSWAKANSTPAAPAINVPSNTLGTIATLDGKTYQNCQLLKVEQDGIVISDSTGITKITFVVLPADLQKRFGYDPAQITGLTPDQIQADENKRQAAALQAASH
jgi:hypothetical protein